jgi:para-nitrobenzyl esterase
MSIPKHAILLALCLLASACQQTTARNTELVKETQRSAELEGSHWLLVIIQSTDDSQYTPVERQDFSLTFEPGGKLMVRSDCNRGFGSWTSNQPGQLIFGPIALTRMACRPNSIDGRFNQDLAYVRSYVLKGDNLYLATMADGSILEFKRSVQKIR